MSANGDITMIFAGFECTIDGLVSDCRPRPALAQRIKVAMPTNTIQRSYRFRVYPNTTQSAKLAECFGIARFAYNSGLDAIGFGYRTQGQRFTGIDCSRAITELSKDPDYEWIKHAPRTVVTNALRNLDTAFKNFFAGRAKYPRFKKKLNKQTVTFQLDQRQNNWLPGRMLKLPGVGEIKVRWSRIPKGRPKMATVTRTETGKYFVSLSIAETVEPLPKTGKSCGMDAGSRSVASTQDWQSGAPKYTEQYAYALKRAQRHLSRKQKGSKSWHHQRIKVARIHEKISNSRNDFLHKVSSYLVKSHDRLAIQEICVSGMMRNKKLAKTIADASMAELHRQIQYKSEWYGREFVSISRWEKTSGVCTKCDSVSDIGSAEFWSCDCGTSHNRDQASAEIIARKGFAGESANTGADGRLAGHQQCAGVGAAG